ncbi:hypothetical protein TNCV_1153071 [Trichonephila clavipes]|nr:hypothetical protein TNCV_1153071 [Trichonephila clavipes]
MILKSRQIGMSNVIVMYRIKGTYVLSQPIGDIIQNEAHDYQLNAYKVGIAKVASCLERWRLCNNKIKGTYVLSQPIGDIIQNEAHDCQLNAYKVGIAKVASCLERWRLCNNK